MPWPALAGHHAEHRASQRIGGIPGERGCAQRRGADARNGDCAVTGGKIVALREAVPHPQRWLPRWADFKDHPFILARMAQLCAFGAR